MLPTEVFLITEKLNKKSFDCPSAASTPTQVSQLPAPAAGGFRKKIPKKRPRAECIQEKFQVTSSKGQNFID